jgi:hypothetical protein
VGRVLSPLCEVSSYEADGSDRSRFAGSGIAEIADLYEKPYRDHVTSIRPQSAMGLRSGYRSMPASNSKFLIRFYAADRDAA